MTYLLEEVAERELNDAAEYYFTQAGARIGDAFLADFERTAKLVEYNQKLGTLIHQGIRIHPFRRFPYSIIYRETTNGPVIYAVANQHRRPNYWIDRLP